MSRLNPDTHPVSFPVGKDSLSLKVTRGDHEAHHSSQFIAKVKNYMELHAYLSLFLME
jgi:hypothetical protein